MACGRRHVYPLVGRKTGPGKTFWSGRVPALQAWSFPYIVLDDAGATWATITLDCDNRQAMAASLDDLPPFSWLVRTRRGAHVTWTLSIPVGKHQAARAAPEAYLSAVAEYYHHALDADPAFGGLSRNPAHPKADTVWGRRKPYSLDELSSIIPFNWRKPRIAQTGIGRNRDLFMATCRGDRGVSALTMAHALNRDVADAYGRPSLPDSEVAAIARISRAIPTEMGPARAQVDLAGAASGACSDANRQGQEGQRSARRKQRGAAPVGRRGHKPSNVVSPKGGETWHCCQYR